MSRSTNDATPQLMVAAGSVGDNLHTLRSAGIRVHQILAPQTEKLRKQSISKTYRVNRSSSIVWHAHVNLYQVLC